MWYAGTAEGFGRWVTVYSGRENVSYYDDRQLSLFTTYQYRLTAYNDFAFTISASSSPVATFGGRPRRSANVSAYAINHTSILLNWTLPSMFTIMIPKCSSYVF